MAIFKDRLAIHTSDRKVFKRCRRKYSLASKLQRGLQPKRPNNILWLGTGVHHALQLYYEANGEVRAWKAFQDWADSEITRITKDVGMWDEELATMREVVSGGVDLLKHYEKWAVNEDNFEPYKMEVMFSLPIEDPNTGESLTVIHPDTGEEIPVVYEGRFDGIVKDDMGHYWVLEHKTAKSFGMWDDILPLDEQITAYIWAAEYLYDIPVEGVIYNGLRKKAPSTPQMLKSGKGLSKNKAIDTTYEVYMQAIQENNLDPEEYTEILDILKAKGNKFFRREFVRRTPEELHTCKEQIFYEAVDMLKAEVFYPNPTRDCSWDCDFYQICVLMQNKGDVEPLLEDQYEPRAAEEDEFEEKVGK